MIALTVFALVLAIPTVYLFGQQQIENALADLGTDDEEPIPYAVDSPHLDPNSCQCEEQCKPFIAWAQLYYTREALVQTEHPEAAAEIERCDAMLWELENGWPR